MRLIMDSRFNGPTGATETGERVTIRRSGATDALAALPLAALSLYVVIFLVRWSAIVAVLYLNADIASGPVIAQALATAPSHTEVLLGNYPWFEALGFMSILRPLPAHRLLWETVPLVLAVVTVGLVAWGTGRAAGRRAAMLTLVIGLAASPAAVADLGTWTVHGLTWFHAALLGWLAVWLLGARSVRSALIVAGVVGLASGPALASDLLLIPAGILPLWAAAVASGLRRPETDCRTRPPVLLGAALVATVLAAIGAAATTLTAHGSNVRGAGTLPINAASAARLPHNLRVLWESLAALGNGDFFNMAFGGSALVHAVCAGLAIAGVVTALCAAWLVSVRPASSATLAHAAFWGSAAIALLLAFLLTTVPVAAFSGRYLVGVLLAVAALVPLAATRSRGRWAIGAAIAFFALAGVMSLLRGEMTANSARAPTLAETDAVARFVRARSATVGYAGYWDAAPLTWASHFAIHVYPVSPCGPRLCAFQLHRVGSWYAQRGASRSYIIIDSAVRQTALRDVPAAMGKPVASVNVGHLTVYVYDHDVARDFGPALKGHWL